MRFATFQEVTLTGSVLTDGGVKVGRNPLPGLTRVSLDQIALFLGKIEEGE